MTAGCAPVIAAAKRARIMDAMGDRGRAGVGTLLAVGALVGLLLAGNWLATAGRGLLETGPLRGLFHSEILRRGFTGWIAGDTMPPAGADAQGTRILPPVAAPSGPHAFLQKDGGRPVTYSPCRRLSVVVNPEGAPFGAVRTVRDAVARISTATGLSLEVSGTTDENYREKRKAYQPNRYGERWAPILVAWAGSGRVPEFDHGAVGFGGSVAIDPAVGASSYVTGAVVLDRDWFADPANQPYLTEVLLHELGHVVGLDHVTDDEQIMWEGGLHGADLGPGDLAGLARLGKGPCTPDL